MWGGYANCVNGAFNTTFCPDVATCAKECALEGVDYSTHGIKTDGDALNLNLFIKVLLFIPYINPGVNRCIPLCPLLKAYFLYYKYLNCL
jgi:hypothetical protein